MKHTSSAALMWAVAAVLLAGCGPSAKKDAAATEPTGKTRLQGAGATFPAPFYKRLVVAYEELHPDVLIDYQSIGSGGGIRAITDRTVHFCASDAPMSKKELAAVGGESAVVEFPTCAGGVVATYNVPGVKGEIKFTGKLLADIYLGKVSKWNDPAIAKINADVQLPDLAITPVWRTDGSGTTFIFTNYLGTQSEDFKTTIGAGKQVQWPTGQGGKGNEGVTAVVEQTVGGLGYVEQSYAENNRLLCGVMQNRDGKYVTATAESVSAAGADSAGKLKGAVLAADIWNQPGEKAYPIASFTYIVVYKDLNNLPSKESAEEMLKFLRWVVGDGQKYAAQLGYAPLAPEVQERVQKALATVSYKGEALKAGG